MDKEEIRLVIKGQRKFLDSGQTNRLKYRIAMLKKLRSLIIEHEQEIIKALWDDFHKPEFEVIATESRFVLKELNYTIRKLRRWSGPRRVRTPIIHFLSHSYIKPQPYGQVLLMSPWNFPFQLAFLPLVGAIAAGNCIIMKMSRQVPNTSRVMERILSHMPPELVAIIDGDHSVSDYLLDQKFDYIFFTGSPAVGKHIMKKASENLTPVSLELGGKNPCVVTADARLDFAARRIAWGKFINCGQTCVSPDYLLIDSRIKEKFLDLLKSEIKKFYGDDPENSGDFARMISAQNVKRMSELLKKGRVITGGVDIPARKYMAPTILTEVSPGDPVMQEEIFGPVLPVIDFKDFEEVYKIIERNPNPLATYIFSGSNRLIKEFLKRTQSGNASVNDTVMQIASPYLPYGGVGTSGVGRYHGRMSFETFSNMRSVMVKSNLFDIWLRYPPYTKFKTAIVRFLMR